MSRAHFLLEAASHSPHGPLYHALMNLRPYLAHAAQHVYDTWDPDPDGVDDEYGEGGICDAVVQELWGVLAHHLPDVDVEEGGHDGDDHAWLIVSHGVERYGVDIPPQYYEHGGGYRWHKIPRVHFLPNYVEIFDL